MKKNRTTRLIVLVLFLAIVTAVIISGTFAKYTTSVNGTGSATVAKWSVALKADGADFTEGKTFTLADTTLHDKVVDGKIAPGTDGSFSLAIDATGSEVAIHYVLEISSLSNVPTNLKFYKDSIATENEISVADSKFTIEGDIALADVGTEVTLPIFWAWPYETGAVTDGVAAGDTADTTDGIAAKDMTFNVKLTATQVNPTV